LTTENSPLMSLDGHVLGLLDNSKHGSDKFLRYIAEALKNKYALRDVVWAKKKDPTKFAPPDVLSGLASQADFVVAAIGD
jgi:hypothetical protein